MFGKTLPLLVIPAAVAAIAGCGSSAPQAQIGSGAAGATSAPGAAAAGVVAKSALGAFTASELRGALLSKINGAPSAIAPEAGPYASLPEVKVSKKSMRGVVVSPAKCSTATLSGFDSATFANSPAAVATFRVGRNGVS